MTKLVVDNLKSVLANSYLLYLKTHNYHWNITGSHFCELHALFEEQYKDLAEAVDLIAERIRAVGEKAPATFKAFQKLSMIEEGDENASWEKMVKDLYADQLTIIKLLKKTSEVAEKANDEATADIMVERLRVHEKNKWMLKSILD